MYSLTIDILSAGLITLLALAIIYYGDSLFNRGLDKDLADRINNGQNVRIYPNTGYNKRAMENLHKYRQFRKS